MAASCSSFLTGFKGAFDYLEHYSTHSSSGSPLEPPSSSHYINRESSEIRLLRTSHPELGPAEDRRGLCCDFPIGSYRTESDRERRHSRNPISLRQVLGLPSRTQHGVQQQEIRVRRSWAPIHCGDRDLMPKFRR